MDRITISVSDEFVAELATFMENHGYDNKSEAIRDLARRGLDNARIDSSAAGNCIATLSYVFNHHTRELAKRLTEAHHDHHDLHVSTMHVHLDHDNCLEVAVLRGPASEIRDFAKTVVTERGVTNGQVNLIPVDVETTVHDHGGAPHRHTHIHPKN